MPKLYSSRQVGPSIAGFLTALLLSTAAYADSSVYVTNNTPKPITLKISSTLSQQHWKIKNSVVPPFSRKEILETNRDEGITDGKTFEFTAQVIAKDSKQSGKIHAQGPENFQIKLKLRGSTVGSHMWQSYRSQGGTQGSWADDRKKYSTSMNVGGRPWNVTYWAYATGGDDDVEYVFRENYPLPEGYSKKLPTDWRANHLNVLAYNVYMRPTSLFLNGQKQRAEMIPAQLKGYDVVVFQEVFDDDVRPVLLAGMAAQGYKYASKPLGKDDGVKQDGGVIIVSRYPIVDQGQINYSQCSGDDCLAKKGALWVEIDKKIGGKSNRFNVFGTHLNTSSSWSVQKSQLEELKTFIDAKAKDKSEPVIIAGDLNVNMWKTKNPKNTETSSNFKSMLGILKAGYFSGGQLRGHLRKDLTHDGPVNDLGSGSQSYYDYVLWSNRHRKPMSSSFAEVRVPRSQSEWKELETETARWDLSDHYAVYGNMHFEEPGLGLEFPEPSGPDAPLYLCNQSTQCPSGLTCQPFPNGQKPANAVPPPGKPQAAQATTKAPLTKKPSKAAAKAGGKTVSPISSKASAAPKGPTILWSGTCRIPPPK